MIQFIGDYETWRDRQYDHPQPDDGPDERSIRFYSHDYPTDTTLEYTHTDNHSELCLSFSSEEPDSGTKELVYAGENGKSMQELTADLKEELAAYLDAADTSSFYQQQGIPQPDGIPVAKHSQLCRIQKETGQQMVRCDRQRSAL